MKIQNQINPDSNIALILGLGNHGLALLRSLGRRGVSVEAMDSDFNQFQQFSRYCKKFHRVKSLDDNSIISVLAEFGASHRNKTVLFITRDKTVPIISRARKLLGQYFYFNIPDENTIHTLMDKSRLFSFLAAHNCLCPETYSISRLDELTKVANYINYPCILKPALRTYEFKAFKADNKKALHQAYAFAAKFTRNMVVQKWINGSDTDIYFCFVYIDLEGNLKGSFTGKKVRKFPNKTGIASSVVGCKTPIILKETMRLFLLAGYRGFGSAEFKKDSVTGGYQFIEFTVGRTDYNVGIAMANGVDLPFIGYCDMIVAPMRSPVPVQTNKIRWVDLKRDFKAIIQEKNRGKYGNIEMLKQMIQNFRSNTVYTLFSKDDPIPFLKYLLDRFCAIFIKIRKIKVIINSGKNN